MNTIKSNLRSISGIIIGVHGLLRIVFYSSYIEFVLNNFSNFIFSETILVIGAALFPFIEFFTGFLLFFNVITKKAIISGILISVIMSAFIIVGHLYLRLIYHGIVLGLLIAVYLKTKSEKETESFI
ncbi:hypothetical protein [Ulvibacter antarcticus]|nr:hypothetical protein [Ulvibacter antarcticus]